DDFRGHADDAVEPRDAVAGRTPGRDGAALRLSPGGPAPAGVRRGREVALRRHRPPRRGDGPGAPGRRAGGVAERAVGLLRGVERRTAARPVPAPRRRPAGGPRDGAALPAGALLRRPRGPLPEPRPGRRVRRLEPVPLLPESAAAAHGPAGPDPRLRSGHLRPAV